MSLPGLDPADPTPGNFRHLVPAAGRGSGTSPEYRVWLCGNKTSAGSETVDTLGDLVADDADAQARMGLRSELYAMYRQFVAENPNAEIYFSAVTESGGSASNVTFTFGSGPATANSSVLIEGVHGESYEVAVTEGDTASEIADAVRTSFANAAEGTFPITGTGVSPAVIATYIHAGPRGTLPITRMRMSFTVSCGVTVSKGSVTAGTTEDDGTAALAAAAAGEFFVKVLAFHTTSAVSSTDNQIGEAIRGTNGVETRGTPVGGFEETVHVGLVGTQAQATTVATSAGANSTRAYFYHAENNDLTPAQLAARGAAFFRRKAVEHPGMKGTVDALIDVPDPNDKADRPTKAEIKADLNNGVTPIAFRTDGTAYIPRLITSRSLNDSGDNDYRAREGHVTVVLDFFWAQVEDWMANNLQDFISGDLEDGEKPLPEVSTPAQVAQGIRTVMRDLVGPTPVGGRYSGPVLSPDRLADMLASVRVTKFTGGFSAYAESYAVEHLIRTETTLTENSPAY